MILLPPPFHSPVSTIKFVQLVYISVRMRTGARCNLLLYPQSGCIDHEHVPHCQSKPQHGNSNQWVTLGAPMGCHSFIREKDAACASLSEQFSFEGNEAKV